MSESSSSGDIRECSVPRVLVSEYHDDPDMGEIVAMFVDELDARVSAFERAWQVGDRTQLASLAHQLKGAAGGYGFPTISTASATLERTMAEETTGVRDQSDRIAAAIGTLRALCDAAVAGRSAA